MPDLTPDRSLRRPPPYGTRERVVGAGRRRRATLAGGAALIIAVPLAAGLVVTRQSGDDALVAAPGGPTADCPDVLPVPDGERSVPAPPAIGPADQLVPDAVPDAALVCRYANTSIFDTQGTRPQPSTVPLEGQRRLDGGLDQLPDDLALPAGESFGACSDAGGPTVPHLMRLDYPTGSVWVSTSTEVNSCAVVTNGAFTAAVYVAGQVAASYEAGAWVEAQPRFEGPCRLSRNGRAGQERTLVPAGWTTLELCRGGVLEPVPPERATAVAALLASLPIQQQSGAGASCQDQLAVPGGEDLVGPLVWRYPSGRDVLTFLFLGCDPPLGSSTLSATATLEEQTELVRLLRQD